MRRRRIYRSVFMDIYEKYEPSSPFVMSYVFLGAATRLFLDCL